MTSEIGAMVHDFTLAYGLGKRMDCTMMLCADRQTARAPSPWWAGKGADHE